MKLIDLTTIDQLEDFLSGTQAVAFSLVSDKDTCYRWLQGELAKFRHLRLSYHGTGVVIRYLDDRRLVIDKNAAENAICPFVLGRKNWLFSASVKGVKASANLYSLIETAKANGLEPYAYLRHVFTELPKATTVQAIEALVPGYKKESD